MRNALRIGTWAAGALLLAAQFGVAADRWGLKEGKVELTSAGPMAFGPDGILFVGDPTAATVVAIATEDEAADAKQVTLSVPDINAKLAELLVAAPETIAVADLAINPASGNAFLSVKHSDPAKAALVKLSANGELSLVPLDNAKQARVELAGAPESQEGGRRGNPRNDSITDLTYIDGKLFISGLAGPAPSSTVRELFFPFADQEKGTNIEIYHAAHGKLEENAVVRTFAPLMIDGEPVLLAGFTCTPLVKFPLSDLAAGDKVRGTTVAELGNRNRPLDMIVYKQGDQTFVLMSNSARGVMKISTDKIQENVGLEEPVKDGNTAGQPFETIAELQGVEQLDRLDDARAVVLIKTDAGSEIRTIPLP
jgi:hypothetical protein